jgi:hypothetical protein
MQRERYGTRIALVPRGEGVERTLDLVVGGESGGVVLPGETADARDLLVPGDYDLRVEGARWRPLSTRIRLTAGKKLTAFVELLAR